MRDLFEGDPKRFEKFRSVPILTHDILLSGIIIHNFNNNICVRRKMLGCMQKVDKIDNDLIYHTLLYTSNCKG